MEAEFHILIQRNDNYLHLKLYGDFDSNAVRTLLAYLRNRNLKRPQVFIYTSSLKRIDPAGTALFKEFFERMREKPFFLIFTGENAPCLAPQGSRRM
jgi:ABC-type transporter Mla MlaB component